MANRFRGPALEAFGVGKVYFELTQLVVTKALNPREPVTCNNGQDPLLRLFGPLHRHFTRNPYYLQAILHSHHELRQHPQLLELLAIVAGETDIDPDSNYPWMSEPQDGLAVLTWLDALDEVLEHKEKNLPEEVRASILRAAGLLRRVVEISHRHV